MRRKQWPQVVVRYVELAAMWISIISALLAGLGWVISFFAWGNRGFFAYLRDHILVIWLGVLSVGVLTLWIRSERLRQQFVSGFSDNFKENLQDNWDFRGPWRIVEKGTLLVTGSNEGGITKAGIHWENYVFTFKARIIKGCLGVIVRAQDLDDYYMFQIRPDRIRPHRRAPVPILIERDGKLENGDVIQKTREMRYLIAWQTEHNNPKFQSVPISPKIEDWFDVKIVVKGQSVRTYIDDKLIYHRPDLLQIPTGKVGFRNTDSEEAFVKEVRVILQS
jgi:hypothetical protein